MANTDIKTLLRHGNLADISGRPKIGYGAVICPTKSMNHIHTPSYVNSSMIYPVDNLP
ncbi:MAG: hypothetical protein WBQ25_12680 [Nitrososphaeraceae archaeon]